MVLFNDDFDHPPRQPSAATPAAEPAEAVPDIATLLAERFAEGQCAGRAEAEREAAQNVAALVAALGQAVSRLDDSIAAHAEARAAAVTNLVVGLLTASFPASFARLGATEAAHFAAAVLPNLAEEPRISLAASPQTLDVLTNTLAALPANLAQRTSLLPAEVMPAGALRIAWAGGAAVRDPTALASRLAEILSQFGFDMALPDPESPLELETQA